METEGENKPAEEKNSSPVDVISVGVKLPLYVQCILTILTRVLLCEH